jgi:glycosyltransferase involved in cell wall biosynthesis
MIENKTIAVVVPAYNEEKQIGMVIETMPSFVDRIVIVNDKSRDGTAEVVKKYIHDIPYNFTDVVLSSFPNPVLPNRYNEADVILEKMEKEEIRFYKKQEVVNTNPDKSRIILINHLENGGVGAAIASGYKWCKDHRIDCVAVMAGDGQMDPSELESICRPVLFEDVDYVKGNRLRHPSAKYVIPKIRFFGNSVLSILTKIASGYWRVSDTQTGYTAISLRALQSVKLYEIYPSYGMPNDFLVKLNIAGCTLKEVTIKPVYRVGEKSKMKIYKVVFRVSWLLIRLFFYRLWMKYFVRDLHPVFLFYNMGFVLGIINIPYLIKIIKAFVYGTTLSYEPLLAFLFLSVFSFQCLFFGMWMDFLDNERLYK